MLVFLYVLIAMVTVGNLPIAKIVAAQDYALAEAARDRGIKKLALTDTNGLYGLVFFVQTAREMGIEPIVGSEILASGHRAVLIVKNQKG